MRPILLLSSVCALLIVLNFDKYGVFNSYKGYQSSSSSSSSGQENGMIQCYKGVRLFYQPTRHERGSALQNLNLNSYNLFLSSSSSFYTIYNCFNNAKAGKLYPLYNSYFKLQIHDHFAHSFSVIGPTGPRYGHLKI